MTAKKMKSLSFVLTFVVVFGLIAASLGVISHVYAAEGDPSGSSDPSSDVNMVPPVDVEDLESIDSTALTLEDLTPFYVEDGEGMYMMGYYCPAGLLMEDTVYRVSWVIDGDYKSTGVYFAERTFDDVVHYCLFLNPAYTAYGGLGMVIGSSTESVLQWNSIQFTSKTAEDDCALFLFEYSADSLEEAEQIRAAAMECVSSISFDRVSSSDASDVSYKSIYTREDFSPSVIGKDTDGDHVLDQFFLGLAIGPSYDSDFQLKSYRRYQINYTLNQEYYLTGAYVPTVEQNGTEMSYFFSASDGNGIEVNNLFYFDMSESGNGALVVNNPEFRTPDIVGNFGFYFFILENSTYEEACAVVDQVMDYVVSFTLTEYE